MSHSKSVNLNPADFEFSKLGDKPAKFGKTMFAAGMGCAGVGLGLGIFGGHLDQFLMSWLIGTFYVLTIGLGGLFFVVLQHLTKAGWSASSRRIAELAMQVIPLAGIMLLPVVIPAMMSYAGVYPWVDADVAQKDHLVSGKVGYLSSGFFLVRLAVYFGIWMWLTKFYVGRSLEQDESGDAKLTTEMESMAPIAMMLFALTVTFAGFDLVMSVDPHWFSTIFGVYIFAGCMLSVLCVMVIVLHRLVKQGMLSGIVTIEHFHDLGKLMFAFTFFWGYIGFSQYMLYWYANIPEETSWFHLRTEGAWAPVAILLLFGHFIIPFSALLSRGPKRDPKRLVFWAKYILVFHALDLFWLVRPNLGWVEIHGPNADHSVEHVAHMHLSVIDFAAIIGPICLGVWWALRAAQGKRLLAVKDPRIEESLNAVNL